MKKFVSFLLALSMLFTLWGCKDDDFEVSYIQTYNKIISLYEYSSQTAATVSEVWNIAGAEYVVGLLSYMLSADADVETSWNGRHKSEPNYNWLSRTIEDRYEKLIADAYGWDSSWDSGIKNRTDVEKFIQICLAYQNNFTQTSALNDELSVEIKDLRSKYGEKYDAEFELLNELYIEVSTYADLALEPTGNLHNYNINITSFEHSIPKLAKAAEIY